MRTAGGSTPCKADRTPCTSATGGRSLRVGLVPGRAGAAVIRAYPVHHNLPGRREVLSWPGAPPAGLGTPRGRTENSTPCKADRTPCTSAGLLAGCCPGSSWRYTAGRYARHSKPLPFLSHLRTISREDGGSDSGSYPDRRCEPSGVRMDSASLSPSLASCDPWTGPAWGLAEVISVRLRFIPRNGSAATGKL